MIVKKLLLSLTEKKLVRELQTAYGNQYYLRTPQMYKSMLIRNGKAELTFKHCSELHAKGAIEGFEIAGNNKKFTGSVSAVINRNKITVSSEYVPEPVYVRYLWTNYKENITLYGENGLPLAPFRISSSDE